MFESGRRALVAAISAAVALAAVPATAGAQPVARGPALEQRSKALAAALLSLEQAPSASSHERVAELYVEAHVLDAAFNHWQAALRYDRRRSDAHEGLARIWRDWGFVDRAITEAHVAVFYAPDRASTHNTLGTVLMALGDTAAARDEFVRAMSIDPSAGYVYGNMGILALKEGDLDAAVVWCEKALAFEPTLAGAAHTLGLAYAATGDYASAHAAFARAGCPSDAAYKLGLLYLSANRLDDAAIALTAAANGAPWSRDIVGRLRQVNQLRSERRP